MLAALAFVMGTAMGSFINVVVDRVPAGQSIVRPRSRCPSCSTELRTFDLIPVLSYLWLRGKCRYCSAAIPVRVLLVEAVTGAAFLGAYLSLGATPLFLAAVAAITVALILGLIALERTRRR